MEYTVFDMQFLIYLSLLCQVRCSYFQQEAFDMYHQLYKLVDAGYLDASSVINILDVGAYDGSFSERIRTDGKFPNAKFICIEANTEKEAILKEKDLFYVISLVGEKDNEQADYYHVDPTLSNVESGNSVFRENTIYFDSSKPEKRMSYTIDSIMSIIGMENSSVQIMKLDIQGSELSAIRGARKLIERSKNILIITEISFVPFNGRDSPSFFDIHYEMTSMGFQMLDLLGYSSAKFNINGTILSHPVQFDAAWIRSEKVSWRGVQWPLKNYPALHLQDETEVKPAT